MEGHRLLVETGGQVAAAVVARNVVIAGAVTGGVVAGERIELRSTARVKGELSAPRIAMADGATLNGRVDTSTRARSHAAGCFVGFTLATARLGRPCMVGRALHARAAGA